MSSTATEPLPGDIVGTVGNLDDAGRAELLQAMRSAIPAGFVPLIWHQPERFGWADLPDAVRAAVMAHEVAVLRQSVTAETATFELLALDGRPGELVVKREANGGSAPSPAPASSSSAPPPAQHAELWIASCTVGAATRAPALERAILDSLRQNLAARPTTRQLDWLR